MLVWLSMEQVMGWVWSNLIGFESVQIGFTGNSTHLNTAIRTVIKEGWEGDLFKHCNKNCLAIFVKKWLQICVCYIIILDVTRKLMRLFQLILFLEVVAMTFSSCDDILAEYYRSSSWLKSRISILLLLLLVRKKKIAC